MERELLNLLSAVLTSGASSEEIRQFVQSAIQLLATLLDKYPEDMQTD